MRGEAWAIVKRFKMMRKALGLTQVEAARQIGINSAALSNYERKKRTPSVEILERMQKWLENPGGQLEQVKLQPVEFCERKRNGSNGNGNGWFKEAKQRVKEIYESGRRIKISLYRKVPKGDELLARAYFVKKPGFIEKLYPHFFLFKGEDGVRECIGYDQLSRGEAVIE